VGTLCYYASDWPRVMDLMVSGKLPAERVVSAEIPIDDILELGFDELTRPDNRQAKSWSDRSSASEVTHDDVENEPYEQNGEPQAVQDDS